MRVYFFSSIEGLVKVIKEFKYSHGAGRLSSHKCDKIKDLGPEVKNRHLVKVIKEFRYSHGAGRLSSHKCDKIKDLGPEVKDRQPSMEEKK